MANKTNPAYEQVLEELRTRVEWMDEERRKSARRLSDLENRLALQERELDSRERRIKELEERLAQSTSQLARLGNVDTQLQHFKDELVKLIEQYDQRRLEGQKEQDKLRRVEQEVQKREVGDLRREIAGLDQIREALELRQAEEARLAGMIGTIQAKLAPLENQVETWGQQLNYVEENTRNNGRTIAEMENRFMERDKRLEPIETRLDVTAHKVTKLTGQLAEYVEGFDALERKVYSWTEQVQIGELERNQRLEKWQQQIDERREQMERYAADWVKFNDQYKEAKMAVSTLAEWQEQIELQQREASELTRVESGRLRSLWDDFLVENTKRWKTFEIEQEQRLNAMDRRNAEILAEIQELEKELTELRTEQLAFQRRQDAQNEAIKKWPRVWLEEIEKAMAHDPSSRRQPALVPVRED